MVNYKYENNGESGLKIYFETKNTDVNKKLSYQLTPESPSPDMSWRQSKSPSSKVKPLVNALDHKKKNISGGVSILSWIKNLTSSKSTAQKKTSSKKKKNLQILVL